MAFFDEIGKKITVTSQDAVQKAKDITEITKLNSQIGDLNKNISSAYTEIGQTIINEYENATIDEITEKLEAEADEMKKTILGKIASVKQLQIEILNCQEQIKILKGIVRCPSCGGEVPIDAMFCGKCGFKMKTEEKQQSTKVCIKCGASIPKDAVFCVNCGTKIEEEKKKKLCPVCGKELSQAAAFCEECGAKITSAEQEETIVETVVPVNKCKQCGTELEEDAVFCIVCGRKVQY